MSTRQKLPVVLTALFVAGIAAAAKSTFAEVDANKDGVVTEKEFINEAVAKVPEGKKVKTGKLKKIFRKKDRDEDGKLSEAEYKWKPDKGAK